MGRDYIGLRIARWRDIARLTQQELADTVGISREHLSRVENGHKPVTDRRLLYAFATALGVSVTDLTGQPAQPQTRDDLVIYSAVPALRGALDDDPEDTSPITPKVLAAEVDRAMAARMACDYQTLAALLPPLVMDARRLASVGGDDGRAGLDLLVRATVCASLTVKPFGHIDLAARLVERAQAAADQLDEPALTAAAAFASSQTALASGTVGGRRRSLAIAARAADQVGDIGGDEALSWYGMLHLQAALSAATLGQTDAASAHHGEAEQAAGRAGADPWRMELTPANVGVWRVAEALEDEPGRAPEYARRVDRTGLRTRQRLAHLHISCGRGWYQAGHPDKAVAQFLAADEVSPAELRSRPSVREIVGQIVRDARRQGGAELRELAVRVGVDPLDPDADAGPM
ncbi:helix-turn-helix transcriptional regulator [Plantactinospora sp. ZYX-F-223]|uniref:helix-turn-helix domain-containing protein n=1 Tax=Plantactinospora sp. ZYX-F-223 TaxID=3144103 RepID=UPI0031FCD4DE